MKQPMTDHYWMYMFVIYLDEKNVRVTSDGNKLYSFFSQPAQIDQ